MATDAPQTTASNAAFASADPGFEALPVELLLERHNALLSRIKLCYGSDRAGFERELMPLVRGYAEFVHLLPATAGNYFAAPGGLLQLGLETAFYSLQGTDAHIFSGRATISERRELEPRWRLATFIGGLCCELHRALSHLIVASADGEEWPALLGGLVPWLRALDARRYYLRWRPQAREARGLGMFALPHVVPAGVLQMLGRGDSLILPMLLASIAGVPQHREHNVLNELVRRSMALVIDRNLLASADRYGTPQYGSHVERYLVDALRRLAAGHSAWTPNREKSRIWFGPEGLFLAWPGAAEDVLDLLERDQLAGIPKSPQTLLELLMDAGVFAAQDPNRHTWMLQPPGAKAPLEFVRLSNPALLLHGLDPAPVALTKPLLPPKAEPRSATAPEPPRTGATAPPEDAKRSHRTPEADQLSLLDPPPAPVPPPAPAPPPVAIASTAAPAVALKAPLRLNPAVRSALAEAVAHLNDSRQTTDVCTVAQGVFVPLCELERNGVLAGIAMRALSELGMLSGEAGSSSAQALVRQTPTGKVHGVILRAVHVDGLDPAAFVDSGANAPLPVDVAGPLERSR